MRNKTFQYHGKEIEAFCDPEAKERYDYLVRSGQRIFATSSLLEVNTNRRVSDADLRLVHQFHYEVSPQNPQKPWRIEQQDRLAEKDSSYYANWELPNGPLESIELAGIAADFFVREIRAHLYYPNASNPTWLNNAIYRLEVLDPNHAAAAGLFHDEGRQITHQFGVNEYIGNALLRRIGIRRDIRKVLPDEQVMFVTDQNGKPSQTAMDQVINNLDAEATIVRLADEFGKREPTARTRIYTPEDYTLWDRQSWAKRYASNPNGGRPTDILSRTKLETQIANVPFYFESLDRWVRAVSKTNLKELTDKLGTNLNPILRPIS